VAGKSHYPGQFRKDAVELVRSSDRPFRQIARDLGVNHETLRGWVNAAKRARAPQPADKISARFGPWSTVYQRKRSWALDGLSKQASTSDDRRRRAARSIRTVRRSLTKQLSEVGQTRFVQHVAPVDLPARDRAWTPGPPPSRSDGPVRRPNRGQAPAWTAWRAHP
jgi:transposase-like protein